jgi:hypothetical protein
MRQHSERDRSFYRYAHAGDGSFKFYAPAGSVAPPYERTSSSRPNESSDSLSNPPGVPRPHGFRRLAWRAIGMLAIGTSLYGCARIGSHAQARDAMLDWLTLGQGQHVLSIGRTVHRFIVTIID